MPVSTPRRRLLVHIAFHFVEARTKYLAEVIANFASYDLDRIEVVVDTNSDETRLAVGALPSAPHVAVRVQVHDALPHPFALTWAHRAAMPARQSEFDLFMYIEDDILVPWSAVEAWLASTDALYARGFLRGFLRTEENEEHELLAADWAARLNDPIVHTFDGQRYVRTHFAYHAFWIYTAEQVRDFMRLREWRELGMHRRSNILLGNAEWWLSPGSMRERAAFGMIHVKPGRHRVLLPLAAAGQIDPICHVKHLPNNYALTRVSQLSSIRVDDLIRGEPAPAGSLQALGIDARSWAERLKQRTTRRIRANPMLHTPARAIRRALQPPG